MFPEEPEVFHNLQGMADLSSCIELWKCLYQPEYGQHLGSGWASLLHAIEPNEWSSVAVYLQTL